MLGRADRFDGLMETPDKSFKKGLAGQKFMGAGKTNRMLTNLMSIMLSPDAD
jgi:hypothetical protein